MCHPFTHRVAVGYCIPLFFLLTAAAAVALKYIDPPHNRPTLPGAIASDIQEKRSSRHVAGHLGRERTMLSTPRFSSRLLQAVLS